MEQGGASPCQRFGLVLLLHMQSHTPSSSHFIHCLSFMVPGHCLHLQKVAPHPRGQGRSRNFHVPYLKLEPAFLPVHLPVCLPAFLPLLVLRVEPRPWNMISKQTGTALPSYSYSPVTWSFPDNNTSHSCVSAKGGLGVEATSLLSRAFIQFFLKCSCTL